MTARSTSTRPIHRACGSPSPADEALHERTCPHDRPTSEPPAGPGCEGLLGRPDPVRLRPRRRPPPCGHPACTSPAARPSDSRPRSRPITRPRTSSSTRSRAKASDHRVLRPASPQRRIRGGLHEPEPPRPRRQGRGRRRGRGRHQAAAGRQRRGGRRPPLLSDPRDAERRWGVPGDPHGDQVRGLSPDRAIA